jgi:tetratricopeptide (TPR) repeat protein
MADKTFDIGINTLKKAYIFIDNNQFDEALVYLDKAVSLGVKEAFQDRAWCLQALGYDLDAIEDFDKAMLTAPHDANLYFGRGLSKSATGDLNGAVLDGELAVTFSKYENEINEWRNKEAQKKGHESATKLYELHLAM